ncbi:hypothetical protein B0G74_8411 [Paraburkholderia sp. BL9I2N2]|jgi:hypothetical protein|nr:hypothetical protein B0G74_8411 [Paraburkholderia sp. BL9I2N2]
MPSFCHTADKISPVSFALIKVGFEPVMGVRRVRPSSARMTEYWKEHGRYADGVSLMSPMGGNALPCCRSGA